MTMDSRGEANGGVVTRPAVRLVPIPPSSSSSPRSSPNPNSHSNPTSPNLHLDPIPPPPKRLVRDPPKAYTPYSDAMPPTKEGLSGWFSRHGKQKGTVALEKGIAWSDWLGVKMNGWAEAVSFWCFTLLQNRAVLRGTCLLPWEPWAPRADRARQRVSAVAKITCALGAKTDRPPPSTPLPRSVSTLPQTGSERFYPVTGDFTAELEKVTRILQSFTVDGIEGAVDVESKTASGAPRKVQKKVIRFVRGPVPYACPPGGRCVGKTDSSLGFSKPRKIPAKVIREAKGVAIFTSMRSGIAPLGGAGGAGMVIARLEDGSWSAPSSMSPNNLSFGLMLGVDIYDAVLSQSPDTREEAIATYLTLTKHPALACLYEQFFELRKCLTRSWVSLATSPDTVTLGAELGVAAGPYGAGAVAETGKSRVPILSYLRSRGMYAGVEAVAQIYVTRNEENENAYFWPGITPRDILTGKVRAPREAEALHQALEAAETGEAQRANGDEFEFEQPFFESEDLASSLGEGEVLRLPPTPAQVEEEEAEESRAEAIKERSEKRYLR
ncbi:BZ3500_MvSof-1268-A1-R1_Chr3-1g05615 [Microbotryum saponariae]|uniref:BZ3500_MvSof-1268-A1-R1_Chr3-1g05615 protein n=1 Tax=Microbotryum saponariae TaxID=289078 RepID=A0A2X0KX19_9BASI|nr:BZ3500_MvSof-1268-A1-R1_Chr3-1g05615 [Microbotryum saponariae]SDA04805.1 BZ3501_MvSof-1269-A2-R1_Chr3-1g05285 [Microbotryum saponariae]